MKTDDLINLLALDAIPVRRHVTARRLSLGLAMSVPLSVFMMVTVLGVNPELSEYFSFPMFWVKFGTPVVMAVIALSLVARLGRPGASTRVGWWAWCLPIIVLWVIGVAGFSLGPTGNRASLLLGGTWRVCAENIAVLSLPVFLAALWTLKGLAPTRPAMAGAGAGALGGATGAAVYAIHCPELAAPFIAIWYVLGMLMPVGAGALLGTRLLRW